MTVNNKRYEAVYYQQPEITDSIAFANEVQSTLLSKYTEEQLANPSEEMKQEVLEATFSYMMDLYSKKAVWFMINEQFGEYYIINPIKNKRSFFSKLRLSYFMLSIVSRYGRQNRHRGIK